MTDTNLIELYNCYNMELLSHTADNSVDIILTDPPYMYLPEKPDRHFDLTGFYKECYRVLNKEHGMLTVFGRGVSFYKTGSILSDLGFKFKEEIIWHKVRNTSPVTPISRVHETVAVFGLGKAKINPVRVPITEKCKYEPEKIALQINMLSSAMKNPKAFERVKNYFETGEVAKTKPIRKDSITLKSTGEMPDRNVSLARIIAEGGKEESVMRETRDNFYGSLHPMQKPVKLLKRLLNLVKPECKNASDVVVADYFGGSFSTMAAVKELGMRGVSCEIDKEYFDIGKSRFSQNKST